MSTETPVDVTALAVHVTTPEPLRWADSRRDMAFTLLTLTARLLPHGGLAAEAYGRPTAADRAGALWAAHRGLA